MKFTKRFDSIACSGAVWMIALSLLDCDYTDAQTRKRPQKTVPRGRGGAGRGQSNANDGIYIITVVFILCLLPPLYTLVRSIITDPMTPTIMRDAAAAIKERTTGYLSARGKKQEKKT